MPASPGSRPGRQGRGQGHFRHRTVPALSRDLDECEVAGGDYSARQKL